MSNSWPIRGLAFATGLLAASLALASTNAAPSTQPTDSSTTFPSSSSTAPSTSFGETGGLGGAGGDFGSMSLEELLNVEVSSPAALTATDTRRFPVDVTTLDAKDIFESGARDLNHLLEDYVPNTQFINHNSPDVDLGFRGIISDREDKYLYQVNGITMNNRMLFGANDERDLPMMGDINTVDVVRGPASATYGSGALAGVIDVNTYNGLTFQGADMTVRQGVIDQYSSGELRYGRKLSDTSGLFMYYGAAAVEGVDSKYYFGSSFPAKNGLPATVFGQPYTGPKQNYDQAAFDAPFQKGYVDYVDGPWDVWARFVQDGTTTLPARNIYTSNNTANLPPDEWTEGRETKNQQFTTAVKFKKDLSSQWNLQLQQSYDVWLAKDQRAGVALSSKPTRSSYENQLFSQAIATWTPVESQSLAFGTEFSHLWYHDPPTSDSLDETPVVTTRDWQTDTYSFLAEDQWKINKQWSSFLSFRADKNTYTEWLLSPRATIVFEPNPKSTYKAMVGQSVRRQDDEDIWGQWFRTRTYADPEKLLTYEVSYDHKFTDQVDLSTDVFFEDYNATGWDPSAAQSSSLGHFQIAGGEIALTYRTESTRITASEGVSQLIYASVPGGSPAAAQGITAAPYGFGDDLANWAPSISKVAITHDFNKKWSASSSVVYYSGFPGGQDYANYAATLPNPPGGAPLSPPGYGTPYGPNLYWNLGLEWRPIDQMAIRVDGYNLAGIFDPTLSKRNYILRTSEFSLEPPEVAFSIRYKF
jgi:iron complex outermembrane receptor protein